jgi:hypothetical protein
MYRSRKILIVLVALTSIALSFTLTGAAAAPSAHAAGCTINGPGGGPCPKLGYYHPSPTKVQLPNGGKGYTSTLTLEAITDYSHQSPGTIPTAFMVELKVTAQRNVTISCKLENAQIVPSDTHMNLYLNGRDIGYVGAYKSTCGNNPKTRVALAPGKSIYWFALFHFTPHPGYRISISQFGYSTPVFRPYGSMVPRVPYTSPLSSSQLSADFNYLGSFLKTLESIVSEQGAEDWTSLLTDLEGCSPDGFSSCAKDVMTIIDAIQLAANSLQSLL